MGSNCERSKARMSACGTKRTHRRSTPTSASDPNRTSCDAHFYGMDNIEKAASAIPRDKFSILISHTPEVYLQAAHSGFDLMLSGHTHGGQICLPGGIPITLDSVLPRSMGAGAWKYHDMIGYTSVGAGSSVVPVRFNCPPEITLHHLHLLS